ncbi:MAG: TRAP transporter small permease [Spirochaetaceae bacterium]|nr:TRAP transporter small permease [Spirochaetaceae bacterium]
MNKFFNVLFKVVETLIAVFLALMIILVFMNVVGRYIFNKGFVWSEEVSRLCFIFLVYLGSIEAMRDNRHLLIDTLLLRLPKKGKKILYAITQILIIWLMVIQTRGSLGLVIQNRNNVWITTGFPAHIVHLFGLLLGVSIAAIAVYNLVRLLVFKEKVAEIIKIRDDGGENATVE